MEEDKNNMNRRRKSIMVIDKKGQAREVSKDGSKGEISTLIDSTDKTKKSRANTVDGIDKDMSTGNVLDKNNAGIRNLSTKDPSNNKDPGSTKLGNNDLSNSKLLNRGLSDSNLNTSKVDENKEVPSKSEGSPSKSNEKPPIDRSSSKNSANNNLNASRLINDNTNTDEKGMSDKKTLSMKKSPKNKYRNVEIAAGATSGAAAEVLHINQQDKEKDKHVIINEQESEEHEVSNDGRSIPITESNKHNLRTRSPNSSGFSPQRIPSNNLHEDSGILTEREKNNVEAEGYFYKRRRIFACFWHEKYFLLTKTGILKYYKANGTRVSKGNWDLRNIQRIHEVFMGGENHPFRLALMNGDENLLFGFDDSDNREYWLIKLSKYINK